MQIFVIIFYYLHLRFNFYSDFSLSLNNTNFPQIISPSAIENEKMPAANISIHPYLIIETTRIPLVNTSSVGFSAGIGAGLVEVSVCSSGFEEVANFVVDVNFVVLDSVVFSVAIGLRQSGSSCIPFALHSSFWAEFETNQFFIIILPVANSVHCFASLCLVCGRKAFQNLKY